jgi:hypothetical protein
MSDAVVERAREDCTASVTAWAQDHLTDRRRYRGSMFTRRAEVKAMMAPQRLALVLRRPVMGPLDMLQDEVLADIRLRLAGMVARRGHWTYGLNRHRALINAYLAVRWARLLARQAIRSTAMSRHVA